MLWNTRKTSAFVITDIGGHLGDCYRETYIEHDFRYVPGPTKGHNTLYINKLAVKYVLQVT